MVYRQSEIAVVRLALESRKAEGHRCNTWQASPGDRRPICVDPSARKMAILETNIDTSTRTEGNLVGTAVILHD